MSKNILLTCFGSNIAYEFIEDFKKREDINLYVSDMDPQAKVRLLTKQFLNTLSPFDSNYSSHLLEEAKKRSIEMIIPGGDEEALALMKTQEEFQREGIIVAVQKEEYIPLFQAKSSMYDYLKPKGIPLPNYGVVKDEEDFETLLEKFGYPEKPLLIKPDSARGGRGIVLLSEWNVPNRDNLHHMNSAFFKHWLDGKQNFILMDYIEGIVFDIDILRYKEGDLFIGQRERFTNVTKQFSGNIFQDHEGIQHLSEKLVQALPTDFLIDYDLMLREDGQVELLEINPRPSGSTVSYVPHGYNLYYSLAKSFLFGEHIDIPWEELAGKESRAFLKMVKG